MLHAFNQKNVRRILARSGREHANECSEDAITSMVFTPLTFMSAPEALKSLVKVLGDGVEQHAKGRTLMDHKVELWPSGLKAASRQGGGETRCEPDLVVRFLFSTGDPLIIIGEMKWDWRMKFDDLSTELKRQREALAADPPVRLVQFVLSRYRYPAPFENVITITWRDVADRILPLARSGDSAASRWAKLVIEFLKKADVTGFSGFPLSPQRPPTQSAFAFWNVVND